MLRTILLAGFSVLVFSCNDGHDHDTDHDDHPDMHSDTTLPTSGSPIKAVMDKGMQQMHDMKPTGNNDADFSMMMMEHHKGAVAMARIQVEKGTDTALKNFATKMISDQEKEISVLQGVLSGQRRDSSSNSQDFMDAMYSTMTKLMSDSTQVYNNIDRDFAAQMIPHHQSAVDMAKVYLRFGKDASLKKLSTDIVNNQAKEIDWLRKWLAK